MKHKGKHVFSLPTFVHMAFTSWTEKDKAARKKAAAIAQWRWGMGAECAPITGSPHSHSTLMTHLPAEDGSDWSVKWNKHSFGARQALIGFRQRPSIQN